ANDAASFGGEVTRLLSHPQEVKSAGEAAKRTIYRSWSTVVTEVGERYEDLCSRFHSSSRS
ncbi:MAG: hypothetical protein GXY63_01055, partial [Spirochaetales bacterium]|nr:hypothetical protein [Spirochaetales bacterium]